MTTAEFIQSRVQSLITENAALRAEVARLTAERDALSAERAQLIATLRLQVR